MDFARVVAASETGDGVTETLTIDPPAARAYDVNETIVSFLRLSRLEDEHIEIVWHGVDVASAVIRVREIPNEAPA